MSFLERFAGWEDTVEFPAQSVIFSEQAPADVMYVVLAGEVELTLHGRPLGAEAAGGVIGEMAMFDAARRSSTAVARTAVRLARVDREQLRKMASEDSKFSFHVMSVLANRLRSVDAFISTQIPVD